MKTIYIINGPNLNLLGIRQPEIYGNISFDEYFKTLQKNFPNIDLHYYQSNHEGDIIDIIQNIGFSCDGIILNPAGLTHTSVSLADTIKAITTPVIEVHISNIYERESYRKINFIKDSVVHSIVGHGLDGYKEAIEYITDVL